ncbi:MAG TPA: PEP-CTERM sorting domain-containing protein [Gemmatales bacterium]|nr:PEP-CTERM sorting domain-containing protein [Gemmatales bacterium]
MRRLGLGFAVLALSLLAVERCAAQTYLDLIGYSALQQRLGAATPTGAGITMSQIEGGFGDPPANYRPDVTNPNFSGKTFNFLGGPGGVSGHATGVGLIQFGNAGMASGVSTIDSYCLVFDFGSTDWAGGAFLNFGTSLVPAVETRRIQNHSWVGIANPVDSPGVRDFLRRLDHVVERDNAVIVVGQNNGTAPMPSLLGNAYNVIAVGLSNGGGSPGPSTADTPGRAKPDLVAPDSFTSFSTPQVSAAAALLLETADAKPIGERENAGRAATIKSILQTGAVRNIFDFSIFNDPNPPQTRTLPLDPRVGAGQLNINRSHLIMEQSEQNPSTTETRHVIGWDYDTVSAANPTRHYFIDLPVGAGESQEANISMNWLRRIVQDGPDFSTDNPTVAQIFLRLRETDGAFGLGDVLYESVSTIDNVQLLYVPYLAYGQRVAIEVDLQLLPAGQTEENYAISWLFTPVPEPTSLLLGSTGVAGVIWITRRRRRR